MIKAEKVPLHIMPSSSSSITEYLTKGLISQYTQQTEHFKSLVSADNALMPFYIALMRTKRIELNKKWSLLQLEDVLLNKRANNCNNCGHLFGAERELSKHEALCEKSDTSRLTKLLLTFNRNEFLCQMGCPGSFNQAKMVDHMITEHSEEELWRWSIRKTFL